MRSLIIANTAILLAIQPLPALADTWWLVIGARARDSVGANWSLPMSSEEQCEEAGNKIKRNRDFHGETLYYSLRYICLKGK